MLIKTASDLYEATLTESNTYPTVPTNLIGDIASELARGNEKYTEYVMLPRLSLLCIQVYSKTYKVGGITGPYACIEWPAFKFPGSP